MRGRGVEHCLFFLLPLFLQFENAAALLSKKNQTTQIAPKCGAKGVVVVADNERYTAFGRHRTSNPSTITVRSRSSPAPRFSPHVPSCAAGVMVLVALASELSAIALSFVKFWSSLHVSILPYQRLYCVHESESTVENFQLQPGASVRGIDVGCVCWMSTVGEGLGMEGCHYHTQSDSGTQLVWAIMCGTYLIFLMIQMPRVNCKSGWHTTRESVIVSLAFVKMTSRAGETVVVPLVELLCYLMRWSGNGYVQLGVDDEQSRAGRLPPLRWALQ